jgi:hypothetical protein
VTGSAELLARLLAAAGIEGWRRAATLLARTEADLAEMVADGPRRLRGSARRGRGRGTRPASCLWETEAFDLAMRRRDIRGARAGAPRLSRWRRLAAEARRPARYDLDEDGRVVWNA